MRIACLQFDPQVGDIDNNLNRADAVLNRADPCDLEDLDLLVLPEMAFTGYNFKSREQIEPYLEPAGSGISALWARTTALKYDCKVAVGYPEKESVSPNWNATSQYFNSLLLISENGETLANYRKQHLYYTDEPWAQEGSGGFFAGDVDGLGKTAMGICMDINPYKFEAPWHSFEFAFHILESQANVVIVSTAWSTLDSRATFCSKPYEPDMDTLEYWAQRLEPLIRTDSEDEIIIIFANRCGYEDDALYAGTSAVFGIRHGEVNVYGVLGRGTKHLLVVDTDEPPFAKLVSRPGRQAAEGEWDGTATDAEVQAEELNSHIDILDSFPAPASHQDPTTNPPLDFSELNVPEEDESETAPTVGPRPDDSAPHVAELTEASKDRESTPVETGRPDSPLLGFHRPRLTVSTTPPPILPAKHPHILDALSCAPPPRRTRSLPIKTPHILDALSYAQRPLALSWPVKPPHILDALACGIPPRDLITPPPSGDFPETAYQSASVENPVLSAQPHTPEEPDWPTATLPTTSESMVDQDLLDDSATKPLPLPPPLEGSKPLPLLPGRTEAPKSTPVLPKDSPAREVCAKQDPRADVEVEPVTAILATSQDVVLHGEKFPLVLKTQSASENLMKQGKSGRGFCEAPVPLGVKGAKEMLAVQLPDQAVTLSIGVAQ